MTYSVNKANTEQLLIHLKSCDFGFVPPLSKSVDLKLYADKLSRLSTTFELWEDGIIIGCVACYLDNPEQVFVTNVSVLPECNGNGYARLLLSKVIDLGRQEGKNRLVLEVNTLNQKAVEFYQKFGFKESDRKENSITMNINL